MKNADLHAEINAVLAADTPTHDAARLILRRRMDAVADTVDRLRRGLREGQVEPGHVHQVRVSVRRASAAMRAFADHYEPDRLRRIRRRLRRLRRAIGVARACDVGVELLAHDRKAADLDSGRCLKSLERVLRKRRKQSIRRVRGVIAALADRRIRRWGRRLIRPDAGAAPTLARAAECSLGALLADVVRCGEGDLHRPEALHEMRLAAKRLRYATEVFGPCFDPARLDEAAGVLVRIQDRLGAANDLCEIISLIDERIDKGKRDADRLAALRDLYAARFEETRNEFIAWWRSTGRRELRLPYAGMTPTGVSAAIPELGSAFESSEPPFPPITPGISGIEA